MKRVIALALVSSLFFSVTSSGPSASWSERLREWLPDFIEEWWWPQADRNDVFITSVTAHSDAFSALPRTENTPYQLQWPYAAVDHERAADRWREAVKESVLLQAGSPNFPLAKGSPFRLLFPSDDYPVYLSGLLSSFGPMVKAGIPLGPTTKDQVLQGRPDVATVIFSDDNRLAREHHNWFHLADSLTGPVILLHFGSLTTLAEVPEHWTVIHHSARNAESESILAQSVFGATELTGRVLSGTSTIPVGSGENLVSGQLGFALPATLGFDPVRLERVDKEINYAIRKKATPGAQLVVSKQGKIVYQKSYGHQTYRRDQEVYSSDLYDLASVTKSAATTLAVMKLYDNGTLKLDDRVRDWLPELARRPAGRYTVEQLLAHQTGLQADLPLGELIGRRFVAETAGDGFSREISPDRWLSDEVPGKLKDKLKNLKYTRRPVYRYSDVNYVLLQLIVEAADGRPLDELLRTEIYGPLGLERLDFRPAERFDTQHAVPTSVDKWMGRELIRGYVHDEGAALLGGVAGHAGLFGNAADLATLFNVLINGGEWNGRRIFRSATVETFTKRSRFNYRALGFDRIVGGWKSLIREGVSDQTFGHTGFSGTSVWADPENEIVVVLLTNRIHPDPKNDRLMKMDLRGKVQRAVYRALRKESA